MLVEHWLSEDKTHIQASNGDFKMLGSSSSISPIILACSSELAQDCLKANWYISAATGVSFEVIYSQVEPILIAAT